MTKRGAPNGASFHDAEPNVRSPGASSTSTGPAGSPTSPEVEVLICGAGPTGLVLALGLARHGIRIRLVDHAEQPGGTSRALVVHARTLELYRQMGIAEAFMREGLAFTAINLWVRGKQVGHVELGPIGRGLSPYPTVRICAQDRHERFLIERLHRLGIDVERGVELLDCRQDPHGATARLRHADGREEICRAAYLAGCDGAHSRVREVLGTGFPGGTYSHVFYVADVEARGAVMNEQLHVALDDADFLGIFPLRGGTTARLIGTVLAEHEKDRESLGWEEVGGRAAGRLGIQVDKVNWFSTYRVHHRVARHFRQDRVFLAGDAAHVHSPVGGQGMNTGIGDAANLAWKLAEVLRGKARPEILGSYEPERRAFARRLVDTTDRAFVVATSTTPWARFVRTRIVPRILPPLFRLLFVRRFMFRTISQIAIHYRGSPLSAGRLGRLHGGDRLPWVAAGGAGQADNFDALDGLGWQVHVYGEVPAALDERCRRLGAELRRFAWREAMARTGLTRNALIVVRPDGYIGFIGAGGEPEAALGYLEALRAGRQAP